MTPEERDRLVRVESGQSEILRRITQIEKDVSEFKKLAAKAGGAMVALTLIGAFVGSVLTFFKDKIIGGGS